MHHVLDGLLYRAMAAGLLDAARQSSDDNVGDLVLDGKDIVQVAVIGLGPNAMPIGRVDQLSRDAHAVAGLAHAALDDMCDTQPMPNLLYVRRRVARCHRGFACNHEQLAKPGQAGNDVLGDAAGEVDQPVTSGRPSTVEALPLPDKPSVAVLPFTNISGQAEQEYFSDGITEDIITELSRFRSLFVIARNSSFHYKGQSPKVQEIGQELGVQYVVEGSVRKAGNRVRVTAQLVEARSGNHLWAERYDRELEDIFAVQDELVRTIVSTVGGRIDVAGKARAVRLNDTSLRAYDLYLRAGAAQDRNTREDYQLARKYLEQAIVLDPGLAQAYHNLSLVHLGGRRGQGARRPPK